MRNDFNPGDRIYYIPKFDKGSTRYLPVTAVRFSLVPPLLIFGENIVIQPKKKKNGNIAKDSIGSFWVSKEAYEAHQARLSQYIWQRLPAVCGATLRKIWQGMFWRSRRPA